MMKHLQVARAGAILLCVHAAQALDVAESGRNEAEEQRRQPQQVERLGDSQYAPDGGQSSTSRGPAPKVPKAVTRTAEGSGSSGTLSRVTVSEVARDTSHLVLKLDNVPTPYRFTGDTDFLDEEGRVISSDQIKSGSNVTLQFKRTAQEVFVTKVVLNTSSRPLSNRRTGFVAEVDVSR